MPVDDTLADRVRAAFGDAPERSEKRMFGGIAFLERGLMVVGVSGERLMARVGPADHAQALARPHARPMDFTGRPMKGYVWVDAPGLATDAQLRGWIDRCRAFVATLPAKVPRPEGRARRAG